MIRRIALLASLALVACDKQGQDAGQDASSPSAPPPASASASPPDDSPPVEIAFGATTAACARKRSGMIRCLGPGPNELHDDLGKPVGDAVQLAVSDGTRCVRLADGEVECWGRDIGTGHDAPMPALVPGLVRVVELGAKDDFACARTLDKVLCWGDDVHGKLGDWNGPPRATPVPVPGIEGPIALAVGIVHSCAIAAHGVVMCWGLNRKGQLGDGTTFVRKAPVAVHGLPGPATAVGVGLDHACALVADKTVWCWGSGARGAVGDGTTADHPAPVRVSGLKDVAQLAVGHSHACALAGNGTVSCWGANDHGECGKSPGSPDHLAAPVAVADLGKAIKLAAGGHRACAWMEGGEVRCWGEKLPGAGDTGKPVKVAW
ncbi:MAG TPA: hypothetical protein VIF09_02195 [Polyangiaceae bacterium]|jgi:hypothetical protein